MGVPTAVRSGFQLKGSGNGSMLPERNEAILPYRLLRNSLASWRFAPLDSILIFDIEVAPWVYWETGFEI